MRSPCRTAVGCRLIVQTAIWVAIVLGTPAHAFDGDEHRLMGDLAMRAALAYVRTGGDPDPATTDRLDALGEVFSGADETQRYGNLVECVDFFLLPEKMLAYVWRLRDAGRATNPGRTVFPDGESTVPKELADQPCRKRGTLYIQASHSNHAHFQHDLVVSLRTYHTLAVSVAKDEHNLYGALVINAIADHYLQDLFAPGHLVTARDRLTDLPATAVHDLANRMGALFRPDTGSLAPILRFLGSCEGRRPLPAPRLCESLRSIRVFGDPATPGGDRETVRLFGPKGLDIPDPAAALERLSSNQAIVFRGDDELMKAQQAEQRMLLLAVEIQSIVDVIKGTNHFRELDFQYAPESGIPVVHTAFGDYDFAQNGQSVRTALESPRPNDATAPPESNLQLSVFSFCAFKLCDDRLYKVRTRSAIIGASAQRESESRGGLDARNAYSLELSNFFQLIDVSKFSGGYASTLELAPTLGYTVYRQGQRTGNGPTLRLPLFVPETEFSMGPYLRWLSYADEGRTVRRLSHGFRVDAGFSTYATFYVGFGFDYGNDLGGVLRRSTVWTAGFRVGSPLTRLPTQ